MLSHFGVSELGIGTRKGMVGQALAFRGFRIGNQDGEENGILCNRVLEFLNWESERGRKRAFML